MKFTSSKKVLNANLALGTLLNRFGFFQIDLKRCLGPSPILAGLLQGGQNHSKIRQMFLQGGQNHSKIHRMPLQGGQTHSKIRQMSHKMAQRRPQDDPRQLQERPRGPRLLQDPFKMPPRHSGGLFLEFRRCSTSQLLAVWERFRETFLVQALTTFRKCEAKFESKVPISTCQSQHVIQVSLQGCGGLRVAVSIYPLHIGGHCNLEAT